MSTASANIRLRALLGEILEPQTWMRSATPAQLLELRTCLAEGAQINQVVAYPWQGRPDRHGVFEWLLCCPNAAGVVLQESSLVPGSDLPLRLAQAANLHRRTLDQLAPLAYTNMARACAQRFPSLDWYQFAPTPPGHFYQSVPAALLVEQAAPGFNEALEQAQADAGLPVGRQIELKEDREEALRDLVCVQPSMFWVGSVPRAEWMRRLMRDDIGPDLECDRGGIQLLEHIISNHPDLDMVEEALVRGARVMPIVFVELCSRIGNDEHRQDEEAILLKLVQSGQIDLDAGGVFSLDGTLRQYLRAKVPQVLARLEREAMDTHAPPSRFSRNPARL